MAIGFDQIQKDFCWQFTVPRSPRRHEQQRILFANRVRLFDLAKQLLCINKLRFELLAHFRPNVVAASVDARADGSFDILRQRSEATAHFSNAFFDDAFDRATPTSVKHSHGSLLGIDEDNGQAISRLDAQQNAGQASNEAIAN